MRFGLGKISEKLFESLENKGRGYIWNCVSLLGKESRASVADTATTLPSECKSNLGLNSDSSNRTVF